MKDPSNWLVDAYPWKDGSDAQQSTDDLDKILAAYSFAVQELIAGHKPFDDGVEASRYRAEAKAKLANFIHQKELEARIDDMRFLLDTVRDGNYKKAIVELLDVLLQDKAKLAQLNKERETL